MSSDDHWHAGCNHFENQYVVVTEKLDGECVEGNTIIETNFGPVPIKEICESNKVYKALCYDHEQEEAVLSNISSKFVSETETEWFEIETESGSMLRVTGSHRVWLPRLNCYRRVDELKEGDEFLLRN